MIGPQKGPATTGRLRARWRQVEVENREAVEIRKQWMQLVGFSQEEISKSVQFAVDLTLEDELAQLESAIWLSR